MPLFFSESKKDKRKKEMKKLAKDIVDGARRNCKYDPGSDPVLINFQKKLNDIKKQY